MFRVQALACFVGHRLRVSHEAVADFYRKAGLDFYREAVTSHSPGLPRLAATLGSNGQMVPTPTGVAAAINTYNNLPVILIGQTLSQAYA